MSSLELLRQAISPSNTPSPASSTPSTPRTKTHSLQADTPTKSNLSSFAPWDREQLVKRLSSFKSIVWSQLPEELCDLEWARRGWVERKDGKRGVECGLCRASVEVIWDWNQLRESRRKQTESESEEAVEDGIQNGAENATENGTETNGTAHTNTHEKATEKDDLYDKEAKTENESIDLLTRHYKPLLSDGHGPKCPWRTRSAELTVLRLPPQSLSMPSLTTRLATLNQVIDFLPPPERIESPKPLPEQLPDSLKEYDPRILQSGLTGWSGSMLGKKGILSCSSCQRRVGLWLFTTSLDERLDPFHLEEEPLDLMAEHKGYCPWTNAQVQTGMPAWQYMYSLLDPKSHKRPREEETDGKQSQLKRLREMLKSVKKDT